MRKFLLLTMMCLLGLFGTANAQNLIKAEAEASSEIRGTIDGCYVYFYLYDSYGDGWNGASLLVSGNGFSETLTVNNYENNYTLAIPLGTYVTVDFRSGNYDSECSYSIKYDEGVVIYEGGYDDFDFYVNCSDIISIQTPPSVPQNLTAVADGNNIVLSWNAVEDAEYYYVYRNYYYDEYYDEYYEYYEIESVTDTTFTLYGLDYATEYCYAVKAYNAVGGSNYSNVACATTLAPPSVPQNLTAVADGNNIVLSWNAVEDAEYYYVYRNDYYDEYYEIESVTDTTFTLYGLDYATEYCYAVKAYNVAGGSNYSNVACATTLALPSVPQNLTAVADGNNIVLSWNAVEDAEGYIVYNNNYYDNYELTTTTDTTFVVDNVELDVEYCFAVKAVNVVGESYASEIACAIVYEEGTKVIGDGDSTTEYLPTQVFYGYSLTQQIYTAEELGLDTCKISRIAFYQETNYVNTRDLKVYMINTDKSYFLSEYDWVNMNELDLVFDGQWEIKHGWVEIDLDYDFVYTGSNLLVCVVDNSGHYQNGIRFRGYYVPDYKALIKCNDDYAYNPYDAKDNYEGSKLSGKNQIKIHCEPFSVGLCQTPVLVAEATSDSTIVLSWNEDENAEYYMVYGYDTEYDSSYQITTTKDITYSVEGLEYSTRYCFMVKAFGMFNESEMSNKACATTYELLVPAAPEMTAKSVSNTIYLSWDAVKYATSYEIYYCDNYGDTVMFATTKYTAHVFNEIYNYYYSYYQELNYETEYCFLIKAVNKLGVSEFSDKVCVTTGRPRPEEPYVTALAINESSIVLQWDSVQYANYYTVYFNDFVIDTLSGTIDTITELEPGVEYCFSVTATNEMGESPRNWACAETPEVGNVIVGDYDDIEGYLPTNIYYNYSLTQQIYTAEELGLADTCEITSVAFYQESEYANNRYLQVFMMNTDKNNFENEYDWVNMADSIKVFEGYCTFEYGWVEIQFNTKFRYEGENILLCVVDNSGNYVNSHAYRIYYTEEIQTLRTCNDGSSYNPYNANGIYGSNMCAYKNQLKLRLAGATEGVELEAPVLAAEAINDSTITLTWNAVEGAESYAVYYEYFKLATTIDTVFTVDGLDYDETYCFTVKAVNGANVSAHSNYVCATTPDLYTPAAPVATATANGPFEIILKWNKVDYATHYNVYQGEEYEYVGTVWYDTTYTVTGLKEKTEYCFVVTAANKAGESYVSETACATTENKTPCIAPEGLEVEVENAYTITLTWEEQSGAKSYKVYRDGSFLADTDDAEFTDTDLDPDTEYCYTVRSVCEDGKSKDSEEVCATTYGGEDIEEETTSVFDIYPNPVEDKLYIESEMEIEEVVVYTITGVVVGQQTTVNRQQSIDVTNLNSGVYFVKIVTSEGEVVKRIVKK